MMIAASLGLGGTVSYIWSSDQSYKFKFQDSE